MKQKKCRRPDCKKLFTPKKTFWQKYCSPKCRDLMNNRATAKRIRKWRKIAEQHSGSAA